MQQLLAKTAWSIALATFGLVSCSDSKDAIDKEFAQTAHVVNGKVEKGPLVRGSQIDMRTLDKTMVPTGESYTTTIENNTGDFNYGSLKVNSPYAKLTADGYFFNEVTGALSNGTIKLDALVDLSDNTTVNVNVLTHLKSQRINFLVTQKGKSFKEANEQAQEELLSQFGLQEYVGKDASQYSITSGDGTAGVLIAISSLILSDHSEAETVEYLSLLSNEFSTTGTFSDTTKERLKTARNNLNSKLGNIASNIKARYQELGNDIEVKDLAYFFDWDGDGIAGNELEDTVKLSQNEIEVPAEGGDFTVRIMSDKPYFLESPLGTVLDEDAPNSDVTVDNYLDGRLYETGYAPKPGTGTPESEVKTSLENNVVKIHIGPTQSRTSSSWNIKIYNARGAVAARIAISQTGNTNIKNDSSVPKLGSSGVGVMIGVLVSMRDAIQIERDLEGTYAFQDNWQPFSASNSSIGSCWDWHYDAIKRLLMTKQADASMLNCYQPFLDTYIALNYYLLSSYWGDIPFYMDYRNTVSGYQNIPRTNENEILTTLSTLLEKALPDLEEKKNDAFTDINSAFFVSRDVARVLLADIYCNQKKWNLALPLLEKVASNGYYSLTESNVIQYQDDSECILGFALRTRTIQETAAGCHPCLDYKDVLLTTAECLYHTGNIEKAKEYIDFICKKKKIEVDDTNVLQAIARLKYKFHAPNYLTFIRRNSLGSSFMGLSSNQLYQLLWPIPAHECMANSSITQNPGY